MALAAKCCDFNVCPSGFRMRDQYDPELLANQPPCGKILQQLVGPGIGANVEVLRGVTQQTITNTTAHQERLMPSFMETIYNLNSEAFARQPSIDRIGVRSVVHLGVSRYHPQLWPLRWRHLCQ